MAKKARAKPTKKPAPRKKGEGNQKAECNNIGCIRIGPNSVVDIPADGTEIFYCPEEAEGHPEHVWRVTNTTGQNGFIVAEKVGYTGGSGTHHVDTVQAQKYEYRCADQGQGDYFPVDNQFKNFRIFKYCRDRKCR